GDGRPVTADALTQGALTIGETGWEGEVPGTPGYVAPELLAGRGADARADQFSFCVALFEALEGRRPYEEPALLDLALGKSVPPPRPRRTPWWLRGTLVRGLAPHPDQRFPGMDALLSRMRRSRARSRAVA